MYQELSFLVAHDQGVLPWVDVTGYLAAALVAWRVRARVSGNERRFWLVAAGLLLALGVNKQLDLQTDVTALLRTVARHDGWYAMRRPLQLLFLLGLASGALVAGAWLMRLVRGLRAPVLLELAGLIGLALFVLIRAASFHHLDVLFGMRIGAWKLHSLIELAALAVALAAAIWAWRSPPPANRRPGYHA